MARLRHLLPWIFPIVLIPAAFMYDVIRAAVNLESGFLSVGRDLAVPLAFAAVYYAMQAGRIRSMGNVPKSIGRLLVVNIGALVFLGVTSLIVNFRPPDGGELPVRQNSINLLGAYLVGSVLTVVSIVTVQSIEDMVLFKRSRNVRRNLTIYLVTLGVASAASLRFLPIEGTMFSTLAFVLAMILAVVNSFRQPWIVYLSRREKVYAIVYSAFLFAVLTVLDVVMGQHSTGARAMLAFSPTLHTFVQVNALFGTVYFGMSFVSTLFHLPTAEVFERKQSELNSLHNLGRLVTQVFDFEDLVHTVTQMAIEVCGARGAWLELIERSEQTGETSVRVVARAQVAQQFIESLTGEPDSQLRRFLQETHRSLLIDDLWEDRRTKHRKENGMPRGALLSVPLLSQGQLIGVLYAFKDRHDSFDRDDTEVMTTFADHATIAIENSRLIARSLERERLKQEMMVAHRMQRRLLPQTMPAIAGIEFAAVSESSTEVGGDYYDFFPLDDGRTGIVVADVAGKGVSAAFYMAELKGIFLSLSRLSFSPRELLVRANRAVLESLEKNAFISVVYAVLDPAKGSLMMSRAGHCPVVFATDSRTEMIRPSGLGLGLTDADLFARSTEERMLVLQPGDVCVLYTDGITESRNEREEEYGYDRLVELTRLLRSNSAEEIKNGILRDVRTFVGSSSYTDDMTLVVVKRSAVPGGTSHG